LDSFPVFGVPFYLFIFLGASKRDSGARSGSMKEPVDNILSGKMSVRSATEKYCVPKSFLLQECVSLIRESSKFKLLPKRGCFKTVFAETRRQIDDIIHCQFTICHRISDIAGSIECLFVKHPIYLSHLFIIT
jgi:hypothetical protein